MDSLRTVACCYYLLPNQAGYGYLPLVTCDAETTIRSTASHTVLKQTYQNGSSHVLRECNYQFPLYDGVALVGFSCNVDGRIIKGVVKEKDEAREDYDKAVERGQFASLLTQSTSASDVFSTSVGNIPANGTVEVEITYAMELKHDTESNALRYEIPTGVAPRYGGSNGLPTPVFSRASHLVEGDFRWVAKVDLADSILQVESPTHPISVKMGVLEESDSALSFNRCRATMTLSGESGLSKQFVLVIKAKNLNEPVALLETYEGEPEQAAVMATLVPNFSLKPIRPEVVFVCDRSGSMGYAGGSQTKTPIVLAASALDVMLHSLPKDIRFNICSFGSTSSFLFSKSSPYNKQTLQSASDLVKYFNADYGGTETYQAIRKTIENRWPDIPLEIVLLTDGDIWRQEELFEYINEQVKASKGQIRVFALGIGDGVSSSLIEGIARAGNGFAQMVHTGERMEQRCVRMLKAALTPHVTDYRMEVIYEENAEKGRLGKHAGEDDDFELISAESPDERPPTYEQSSPQPDVEKPTISLFDSSVDADDTPEVSQTLPDVPIPSCLQAPQSIPSLFSFSRTSVFILLSQETLLKRPKAVVLRGNVESANLELTIPLRNIGRGRTIHQLAARKLSQDLEEGHSWIHEFKKDGKRVKDTHPSQFLDIVKREAVRLGLGYQIMNKWCSFVAVEQSQQADNLSSAEKSSLPIRGLATKQENSTEYATGGVRLQHGLLARAPPPPSGPHVPYAAPHRYAAPLSYGAPSVVSPFSPRLSLPGTQAAPVSNITCKRRRMMPARKGYNSSQQSQSPPGGLFGTSSGSSANALSSLISAAATAAAAPPVSSLPSHQPHDYSGSGLPVESGVVGARVPSGSSAAAFNVPDSFGSDSEDVLENFNFDSRSNPMEVDAAYEDNDEDELRGLSIEWGMSIGATPLVDRLQQIIRMQEFEGYWPRSAINGLSQMMAGETKACAAMKASTDDKWITAIVIMYLELTMAEEKGTWELVVDKAREWLADAEKDMYETKLQQAAALFK